MRVALLQIVDKIYNDIEYSSSISLMGGGPGILLFKLYYAKYLKLGNLDEVEVNIQDLAELPINVNDLPTFCGGQSGLNWFFKFLSKQGYIHERDYRLIGANDYLLADTCLNYLKSDFYDFLHGALGIAHHLLYSRNKAFNPFFKKFLDDIINLMGKDDPLLYHFDFDTFSLDKKKVNPSLSHGMTSLLKFCLECYQNGICKKKSKFIADNIVKFLLANRNADHTHCYFPYVYNLEFTDTRQSRLAWCYGDLTIAYILYQYSILFKDKEVEGAATEILHHSSNRRNNDETGAVDAGLCHGTSGIAYIFSKLWHKTKDTTFYNASQYWFQKTIDYSVHTDGVAGFKKFDNTNKSWVNESGLLEGVAGIGLAIISHLFKDYSWDYCLMLND